MAACRHVPGSSGAQEPPMPGTPTHPYQRQRAPRLRTGCCACQGWPPRGRRSSLATTAATRVGSRHSGSRDATASCARDPGRRRRRRRRHCRSCLQPDRSLIGSSDLVGSRIQLCGEQWGAYRLLRGVEPAPRAAVPESSVRDVAMDPALQQFVQHWTKPNATPSSTRVLDKARIATHYTRDGADAPDQSHDERAVERRPFRAVEPMRDATGAYRRSKWPTACTNVGSAFRPWPCYV